MLHRACLPLAPQYIANLFMEPDMAPVRPSASIIITCDRQQTTLASVTSGGEDIMSRRHWWWQVTRHVIQGINPVTHCKLTICLCDAVYVASSLIVKKDVKEWRKEDSAPSNQDLWSQISCLDEMFECTLGTHPSLSQQPSSSPVHYWCEASWLCPTVHLYCS